MSIYDYLFLNIFTKLYELILKCGKNLIITKFFYRQRSNSYFYNNILKYKIEL